MILGQGTAQTDDELFAEYDQFLQTTGRTTTSCVGKRLHGAPGAMQRRIGKPVLEWTDEDILQLYAGRQPATWYVYSAFLAFLFFRGYRRAF